MMADSGVDHSGWTFVGTFRRARKLRAYGGAEDKVNEEHGVTGPSNWIIIEGDA